MKVLVAYDGTLHARTALQYGMEKTRETNGELVVLHVFNRNIFLDYDAIPQAEEIARRESSRYAKEAEKILKEEGKGIKAFLVTGEGNPEQEIIDCAQEENVDLLLCPTRYKVVASTFRKMLKVRGLETSIFAYGSSPYATVPTEK